MIMKTKYLLLLLTLLFTTSQISSQDILGAIQEQVAEMENEQNGNESNSNSGLSQEEQQQLEEYWEEEMGDARDFISGIDKPNHQCIALLGLFSYQMIMLQKGVEEAETCQMKYDLMGMQLLMLTGGTTLMPCTEELAGTAYNSLMTDFYDSLFNCAEVNMGGSYEWTPLAEKAPKIVTQILVGYGHRCRREVYNNGDDLTDVLYIYFDPKSLVNNIVDLGMRMNQLGCGG
jgi:hypothetical protein